MEDALVQKNQKLFNWEYPILILVLMEDALVLA